MNNIDLGMKNTHIKNLGKGFLGAIGETCPELDNDTKQAVSIMLAVFHCSRQEECDDDANIFEEYAQKLLQYIQIYGKPPSGLQGWICLFVSIICKSKEGNLEGEKKLSEESISEIIVDASTKEIVKNIDENLQPSVQLSLKKEIKKLLTATTTSKLNILDSLLKLKLQIAKNIKDQLSIINSQKLYLAKSLSGLNKSVDKKYSPTQRIAKKALALISNRPLVGMEARLLLGKLLKYAKAYARRQLDIRIHRKSQSTKTPKKTQSTDAEFLWNLLNSHDPTKKAKLPNFIAATKDILKEGIRLKSLGMNSLSAFTEADKRVKDFRETKGTFNMRVTKKKSKEMSIL
jgi:hypothetical protein